MAHRFKGEIKATYTQKALAKDVDHEARYKKIGTGGRTKLELTKKYHKEAKGPDGTLGFARAWSEEGGGGNRSLVKRQWWRWRQRTRRWRRWRWWWRWRLTGGWQ